MVEKAAFGDAVDQCAAEAEIAHRTFKLVGRGLRAIHRQVGKAREAIRMGGNRFGQHVIDVARKRDAFGAGKQISAGPGCGQHMHRDPGLIHLGKAQRPKIRKLVGKRPAKARRKAKAGDGVGLDPSHKRRDVEVFLKGDNAHSGFPLT